jgi:hypothetical protein
MNRPRAVDWGLWRDSLSSTGDSPGSGADTDAQKRPSVVVFNRPMYNAGAPLYPSGWASVTTTIRNNGQIAMLGWRSENWAGGTPPSLTNASIASGTIDAYLQAFADGIAALGYPILILLDEEPNGSWNTWYDATGVSFVNMWRHIHDIFVARGALNATWVLCLNGIAPGGSLTPWFPGTAYVDIAGVDVFNSAYAKGNPWITFDQTLRSDTSGQWGDSWTALKNLDPTGKMDLALTSFGSVNKGVGNTDQSAARGIWITDALETQIPQETGALSDYGRLKYVFWFDQDEPNAGLVGGVETWAFADDAPSLAAFRHGIGSSYYLKGGTFALPTGVAPLKPYNRRTQADRLRAAILSISGLQGFWEGNEAAGATTLADSSGNAHPATVHTALTLGATKVSPAGPTAINFPGDVTNGYADIADFAGASPATTGKFSVGAAFIVSAWPTTGQTGVLISKSGGGTYEWALRVTSAGGVEFIAWTASGGTYATAGQGSLQLNTPYIVMATLDDALAGSFAATPAPKARIHVRTFSAPVNSFDVSGAGVISDTASPIYIGRRGDATAPFNGRAQYLWFSNTAQNRATFDELVRAFDPGDVLAYTSNAFVSAVVNTSGIIDFWPLDDPVGTPYLANMLAVDRVMVPNGQTALAQTSIIPGSSALLDVGFPGNTASFLDASDSDAWSVAPTTGQFSITVGVMPTAFPASGQYATIVAKAQVGNYEWALRIMFGGRVEFIGWAPSGGTLWTAQGDILQLNKWNFITATVNLSRAGSGAGAPRAYVYTNNGQSYGSTDFAGTPANTTTPVRVGAYADSTYPLTGRVSALAFYNAELTRATHDSLYAQSIVGAPDPNAYSTTISAEATLTNWYRFGEASGTVANDSKGLLPGTYASPTLAQPSIPGAARTDSSVLLNTASSYVDWGNNFAFSGVTPFTIELWLNPTVAPGATNQLIIGKWHFDTSNHGWRLYQNSGSGLVFERWDATNVSDQVSAPLPTLNQWHHVVITYDGVVLRMFVDGKISGVPVASTRSVESVPADTMRVANGQYAGYVDELAIYSTSLPLASIRQHWHIGSQSRIKFNGQWWYVNGVNMPWIRLGDDFGSGAAAFGISNPTQNTTADGLLNRAQSDGFNTIRWWMFSEPTRLKNASGVPVNYYFTLDASGNPNGIQPNVLADLDAAVALLHKHNLVAEFSFFNHPTDMPDQWWSTLAGRQGLIAALNVIMQRYASDTAIFCWELGNEWAASFDPLGSQTQAWRDAGYDLIQRFTAQVHQTCAYALATVTSGGAADIAQFIGHNLNLDFYATSWFNTSNPNAHYNVQNHNLDYYSAQFGLGKPLIISEMMVDEATGSGLVTAADVTARYEYMYTTGRYAGAWGWSLGNNAGDGMNVDDAGAIAFAKRKQNLGPHSATSTDVFLSALFNTPGIFDLWMLGEATGATTLANTLSTQRPLTVQGAVSIGQTGIIPEATSLRSVSFPGATTAYLDGGDTDAFTPGQQFSITVGVLLTAYPAAGTFGTIASKASPSAFEWSLRVQSSGRPEFICWTSTGGTIFTVGGDIIPLNQWALITATVDFTRSGSTRNDPIAHTYVNAGAATPSLDTGGVISNTATNLNLGRRGDVSQPLSGKVAALALYGTELTLQQHQSLYNASVQGAPLIANESSALVSSESVSVNALSAAPASNKGGIWFCPNISYETGWASLQQGYYGQTVDGTDPLSHWDNNAMGPLASVTATMKKMASTAWGQQWMRNGAYVPFSSVQIGLDNALNAGFIPFLHWGPWQITPNHAPDYSLRPAAIAAGNHDTFLHQWFQACAAWGRPFFMRWIHEINANNGWGTDNFPWCVGTVSSTSSPSSWTNTPQDLINAHRKVRAIQLQEGAINCALATCFNIMGTAGATSVYHLADMYPGSDNQVDLNTLDGYNQTDPTTGPSFYQVFRGVNASPSISSLRDSWGELMALDPSGSIPMGMPSTTAISTSTTRRIALRAACGIRIRFATSQTRRNSRVLQCSQCFGGVLATMQHQLTLRQTSTGRSLRTPTTSRLSKRGERRSTSAIRITRHCRTGRRRQATRQVYRRHRSRTRCKVPRLS